MTPGGALVGTLLRHRRWLAAACAAVTVALTVSALAPRIDKGVLLLVAARDLPAGTVLQADDVQQLALPADVIPDGALLAGAALPATPLAGAVRAREPLTDVRFDSQTALPDPGPGRIASPVRIADAGVVALLRPGDHVDVLGADPAGTASVLAAQVRVLSIPASGLDDSDGGLVVLATTADQARLLAQAAGTSRLTVALRH